MSLRICSCIFSLLALSNVTLTENSDRDFFSPELAVLTMFEVSGHSAFLLTPKSQPPHDDGPWVWYAPTLLQKDTPSKVNQYLFGELLRRGIQVAGVDAGESYGSPDGTKLYSAFYKVAIEKYQLSRKPCLLAQSRGGLMLYNWASTHAEAVRCIAGIYPVTDLRSWPLSTNSREQFIQARGAYGLTDEEFRKQLEQLSPVSHISSLAQLKVPIFHIHGDSDQWVPLSANSCEFVRRYRTLGGDAKIEVIRGKGHEPAKEFFESCDLLAFLVMHLISDPGYVPLHCSKADLGSCPNM